MVWQQKNNGIYQIYLKDLVTNKTNIVHPSSYNQVNPSISGIRIVWSEKNSKGIYNIYLKTLGSPSVNSRGA